jgi:sn-glycerol 3-phosphate transport system ATP-binding protein
VREVAKTVGLEEYLDRKPGQLSGGQRQRVAMGRAMIREPKVFLFDEPLSNLDAKLRVQMRIEIRRLHQRLSATSVFVTHDQVEAMTLADRIVVMNKGIVEQVGAPTDVYDKPESLFVAEFIGSPPMNIIEAFVLGPDSVNAGSLTLRASVPKGLAVGAKVVVGIRPEHVLTGPERADAALPVEFVERLGTAQLLHGALEGRPFIVQMPPDAPTQSVAAINVRLPADRLHFFDAATGRRLREGADAASSRQQPALSAA